MLEHATQINLLWLVLIGLCLWVIFSPDYWHTHTMWYKRQRHGISDIYYNFWRASALLEINYLQKYWHLPIRVESTAIMVGSLYSFRRVYYLILKIDISRIAISHIATLEVSRWRSDQSHYNSKVTALSALAPFLTQGKIQYQLYNV